MKKESFYIMVVDDEESVLNTLEECLGDDGYHVSTAVSAEDALEQMQTNGLPHVVLTDIRMPGLNGIEFTAKIKQEISPEIVVIIMTSHASLETAIEALRLGAYDYLHKPFENLDDVRALVARATAVIYKDQVIEHQEREKNVITHFGKQLSHLTKPEEIITYSLQQFSQYFGSAPALYWEYQANKNVLKAAQAAGGISVPENLTLDLSQLVPTTENSTPSFFEKVQQLPQFQQAVSTLNANPSFLVPLPYEQGIAGVYTVFQPEQKKQQAAETLQQFMSYIEIGYAKSALLQKITDMAIKDGLTGLHNVRFFREQFTKEMEMSKKDKKPISVLFFDVDNFKNYNDTNGHQLGDDVLKITAELLRDFFKPPLLPARYGGEEFIVLLPNTDLETAFGIGEQFRQYLREASFPKEELQPCGFLSVSIGVSEYPTHADEPKEIIECADESLYYVKDTGRNGCVIARPKTGYHPTWSSGYIPAPNEVAGGRPIVDIIAADVRRLVPNPKISAGNRLVSATNSPKIDRSKIALPNLQQLRKATPTVAELKHAIVEFLTSAELDPNLFKEGMEMELHKKPAEYVPELAGLLADEKKGQGSAGDHLAAAAPSQPTLTLVEPDENTSVTNASPVEPANKPKLTLKLGLKKQNNSDASIEENGKTKDEPTSTTVVMNAAELKKMGMLK